MGSFWIDPKGNIIPVPSAGHDWFAIEYLEDELGDTGALDRLLRSKDLRYPYEELHSRGWVRGHIKWNGKLALLGNCIDYSKPMRNTIDPAMNSIQWEVAEGLCATHGIDILDAIND